MKTSLTLLAALIAALPAAAQDRRRGAQDLTGKKEAEAKLKNLKVTLDFKGATLQDVADYIREIADINLFISNTCEGKADDLTIRVQDISLKSVLSLMLKPRGLTTVFRDGVLMITTLEDAQSEVYMELYDIRDLLYVLPDFPGKEIDLSAGQGNVFIQDEPGSGGELPIEDLVKAHTGGTSWDDNPKASISLQNGILVVKQSADVHRQVQRLIGQLRRFK